MGIKKYQNLLSKNEMWFGMDIKGLRYCEKDMRAKTGHQKC